MRRQITRHTHTTKKGTCTNKKGDIHDIHTKTQTKSKPKNQNDKDVVREGSGLWASKKQGVTKEAKCKLRGGERLPREGKAHPIHSPSPPFT